MAKEGQPADLDSVLNELGSFGRYQLRTYAVILLPIMFSAVYASQYIFSAGDLNYRCEVPECESSPPSFDTDGWGQWALPDGADGGRCERLRPTAATGCSPDAFHPTETEYCHSWVYETNYTIVAEFDLACAEWRRTLVGTIHNVGLFAALPLTGYVSDTFGRRVAFIVTATSSAVVGLARSFATSYVMYLVLEFLESTVGSGVYSTGFILALEMVSLDQRVLGGNIISSTFAIGQVVLALVAWALPYWRDLTRAIYAPSLLFVFYYFVVEESVRWLLSKDRRKEAAKIIFKAARMNKKELSPEALKYLSEEAPTAKINDLVTKDKETSTHPTPKEPSLALQVIKSKKLMSRLCICSFWWISVTFIYYGLSINSVTLAGNPYVNFMLTSLIEIPGYALSVLTLDRFGRKRPIMMAFFVCGVSLLCLPFIPQSLQWLQTTLNMLGKMTISMVFSSIYIYTSELYPTVYRHRLLGVCSMIGRIGSITAPQTPLLMAYMESLPYLLFGAMSACSALLTLLTPETLRSRLPDTVAQAEGIGGIGGGGGSIGSGARASAGVALHSA